MVTRVDQTSDPAVAAALQEVRLGQAYFSRMLNDLSEEELREPSLMAGWTRAHVIAHVGNNARAIARLVNWAETGTENAMYPSPDVRQREIEFGASLSSRALRHLSDHAAVQLDVAWRDLPDDRWRHVVRTALGREVPATETVWMRTREVWLHALDLDKGGRAQDVPTSVSRRLIGDVSTVWAARGEQVYELHAIDTGERFGELREVPDRISVEGSLADVMAWAVGRSRAGVVMRASDGSLLGEIEPAPRWI